MWELALIPVVAGGIGFVTALHQCLGRLQVWKDAASSCRLQGVEVSSPLAWRLKLHGRAGPLEVQIEEYGRHRYTRVSVTVPGPPGFPGVKIRREEHKPFGAREIEVGDESFDRAFYIMGPMRLLHALLDAEARRLLLQVNDGGDLVISGGKLQAEKLYTMQVSDFLPLLLDVGRRFAQPMDALLRLAENAQSDPEDGVRLQNLLLLVRELPGDPATIEALRIACSDVSPRVRLRAAKELGAEGRNVLVDLAESLVDDACSAQAISILGGDLPFERIAGHPRPGLAPAPPPDGPLLPGGARPQRCHGRRHAGKGAGA